MYKKFLLPVLIMAICCTVKAQSPDMILQQWDAKQPIQKTYLHTDRDNYTAGETSWFKAYTMSGFMPDTISTTLYVELLNDHSTLISRKVLPLLAARTTGQIELPDTLHTGNYLLRAYTANMLNTWPGEDSPFIFQRNIYIYSKKKSEALPEQEPPFYRVEFFPESGNFIAGQLNTVAFKVTTKNGMPADLSGIIKNDKGDSITSFSTQHDGMGMFDITPAAGTKYYASSRNIADPAVKYYLPDAGTNGIIFRIIPSGSSKFFEIIQPPADSLFTAAYMIGQLQHQVVFRNNFPAGKSSITGTLDVSHLSSGILQVTVFNKFNMPLAERLCFIDNGEYRLKGNIKTDTLNFTARGKNVFHLQLSDTVVGSFSVSVTDADYSLWDTRQHNIISSFLLSSDLRGYIHNPALYFAAPPDSTEAALDLLMMTNGWRRFKWTALLKSAPAPSRYKDPGYIQVSGKVNIQDTRKYLLSKPFLVFITSQDSTKVMRMGITDDKGYFHLDSLLFFGKANMLFKDIRGKKSDLFNIELSADSITRSFPLPKPSRQYFDEARELAREKETKIGFDFDAVAMAEGIMLDAVTVKAKKKSDIELLDEKYASGMFSGFSEHTINLVNTEEKIYQNNIFDYLMGRIPGLNISNDGPDYAIYYRQVASASSMGLIPMTLYLDEVPTDASFIAAIPANQVAMVKVYSNFAGATGNGAGGTLAIYTKKGADIYNSLSGGDKIRYAGYSVIREFYSPDYQADPGGLKADNRVTLLWKPDIAVKGINPSIPVRFYNSDRTRRYKIVAEGITADGKLLMLEKIIEPRPF